ncbi:uncharacterized protein BDR25DRAFT_275542 [Lindgomyces ingoldianus]|uniref:Uncharacterized protein n=1 Tax=Lindgomyces ingoldianus TaxID=673940 RepID=A0ACB6RHK3_9PLEO|nr:uncharacterized protein BDR25DRAFT_275542 [Lindgomyces ingoldianus]KAF2477951.1 hypothetical protein BDR25DRAFT_275542 [Lindgomyces ingoldianus]
MSTPVVEARSLSSLTTLASNPPSYPRNPTHVKHEPLVLYIARVPGSRVDVFLTPMKPRDKVVTAEDVQSSLYYLHIDQPEDTRLIVPSANPITESRYDAQPDQPPQPPVHRKPLSPALAPPSMPVAPKRKPIPGTLAPQNDFQNRQNISAEGYPQKSPQFLNPNYNQQPGSGPPPYPIDDDEGPPLPPRGLSNAATRPRDENEVPPLPPRRPSEYFSSTGTSLTLIRRDPASGAQWNVSRIEDPPVLDVSSLAINDPSQRKRTGAPMYIDILNPGYSKFLHTDSALKAHLAPTSNAAASEQADQGENVFRRRVWMEGSKYSSGGFGHRRINSHDSNIGRESPRNSSESWQRGSVSSTLGPSETPPFPAWDDLSYKTIQVSNKTSTFRGYVFLSPWNGRCEFITGAGGGSLKCRHSVPGLQGTAPVPISVSELRFNLPSSSKATTPMPDESKRSSFFHRPRNSRNSSYISDIQRNSSEVKNSLERLDLSLGQEYAGGGFGGKQAKLGKLIIEDEGLKMVDLLVAANLALWWRAYEKVDGRARSDHGSFVA